MRYRYGTFAENGFKNDPKYPSHYKFGPENRPNSGCLNPIQASNNEQDLVSKIDHQMGDDYTKVRKVQFRISILFCYT